MKTPELKILIGAPGSGKSTFAKYWIQTEPNWMRVCRDDFRFMHFSKENLIWEEEKRISTMIDAAVDALLNEGVNVLIDATHCREEYINDYLKKFNSKAKITFKLFDEPLNVLLHRCKERRITTGRHIPNSVIERFYKELQLLKKQFDFSPRPKLQPENRIKQQNESLPKAIICDLDGTLALLNGRNPFDASRCDEDLLNVPVGNLLKNYHQLGFKILLLSGRESIYREPTLRFLEKHQIHFDNLWMREKGDFRKDALIKKELFFQHISNQYSIEFVLDDRNQVVDLWRNELELPCFQVYYGDF